MKVLKFIAGTFCMLALSQAQATMWVFNNPMSGGQEVPANNSQAIGRSWGTYDDVTNQLTIDVSVTGLGSNSTAAHIHKAAAGALLLPSQGLPDQPATQLTRCKC